MTGQNHMAGLGGRLLGSGQDHMAGLGGRLLGSGHGAFSGLLVPISLGAVVASTVISLLRRYQPGIFASLPAKGEAGADKTLEELIAEKEHLEDMIAEAAAKQSRK